MGGEFSYQQDTKKCCNQCLKCGRQNSTVSFIDTVSKYEAEYHNPDRVHHLYKCTYGHTFYTAEPRYTHNNRVEQNKLNKLKKRQEQPSVNVDTLLQKLDSMSNQISGLNNKIVELQTEISDLKKEKQQPVQISDLIDLGTS